MSVKHAIALTQRNLFQAGIVLLALILSALSVTPANAQMQIEITGVGQTLFPIAVTRFLEESGLPAKITDVIRGDLARNGNFQNVETGNAEVGTSPKPDLKTWSAKNAQALAVGNVSSAGWGSKYEVTYHLYDVVKGQSLGGTTVTVGKEELRKAGHLIADDIIQRLTGERGIFATRLSYVTKVGRQYKLLISDSDGLNAQTALSTSEPIISPNWSPDGKKVAYVSFESRKPVIYVQDLSSGKRVVLSNQKGNNSAPAWSPDGKKLALSLSRDGNTQIYVMNADGTELKRLTTGSTIDTEPQWSPDGNSIYFTSDRGGSPQIYRMSAAGEAFGGAQRVTFKQSFVTSPRISPDGKNLAYVARVGGGNRLHVMDLKTGESNALTNTYYDEAPSFAANGKFIIYATRSGGKPVLAAVSVDGNVKQILSIPGSDLKEPAWGPFMN